MQKKLLVVAVMLALQGCATWNALPPIQKLAVAGSGAALAQSATGTALNVKALAEK